MNHQPFENWLLSEEPLSIEQSRALKEHLDTCERCCQIDSSWDGVQSLIQEAPVLVPAPGFTLRWQERQALQRRKNQQRQSWILFVITGGIAAALLAALGISILSVIKEPDQLLIFSVYRLVTLLIDVEAAGGFLSLLIKSLVSAVPLATWMGLIGLASMISVLWFVLFKRLIMQRRVVQ
jgi:hypothetical protein